MVNFDTVNFDTAARTRLSYAKPGGFGLGHGGTLWWPLSLPLAVRQLPCCPALSPSAALVGGATGSVGSASVVPQRSSFGKGHEPTGMYT